MPLEPDLRSALGGALTASLHSAVQTGKCNSESLLGWERSGCWITGDCSSCAHVSPCCAPDFPQIKPNWFLRFTPYTLSPPKLFVHKHRSRIESCLQRCIGTVLLSLLKSYLPPATTIDIIRGSLFHLSSTKPKLSVWCYPHFLRTLSCLSFYLSLCKLNSKLSSSVILMRFRQNHGHCPKGKIPNWSYWKLYPF